MVPTTSLQQFFREGLLRWYEHSHRPLPWKGEKDPYRIWLSEVILQQTRVEQGLPYYYRFIESYPCIQDLAAAPDDAVMKLWEGLGYYSRARNMLATARFIVSEYGGRFPGRYEEIRRLKGVGPYTAAAIASFAFDLPYAVADGNVHRVLARFLGVSEPVDGPAGKKQFQQLANQMLDAEQPGAYNQAIMDFGATACTPRNPDCSNCPLQDKCFAFREGKTAALPVKAKKIAKTTRFFNYLLLHFEGKLWLHRRSGRDIWTHLYEFPLVETPEMPEDLRLEPQWQAWLGDVPHRIIRASGPIRQVLTHQIIVARFWEIQLYSPPCLPKGEYLEIPRSSLPDYALPRVIHLFLQDNSLSLNLI